MHAGRNLSYREWFLEVEALTSGLDRQGVWPGAVVGLQATASILSARMVYVTRVLGLTLFPLNPAMLVSDFPGRRNRVKGLRWMVPG